MIASDSPFKSLFPIPVTNLNSASINRQPSRFSLRFWSSEHKSKMEIWRKINIRFFPNRRTADVIKVEVDVSGEDIFDPVVAAEANSFPDHLVIMVNGIVGSAADWRYAAEQFVKKLPDKVFVHCSECNSSTLTFDGVDMMGERLAEEVLDVVKRRPEVRKISFVAHSLGGLVARYAVGRLYEHVSIPEPSNHNTDCSVQKHTKNLPGCVPQPRIAGLEPLNFITVATPHLGSRGHKQLPLLCGLPFLERRAPQTAHLLVGRSGKHLFLTDNDEGKPPLLLRMANDSYNLMFISALRAFKRRVAYANANYDHMVGWRTSSIRRQSELPKSNLLVMDEKYPHIVYVERESTGSLNNRAPSDVEDQIYDVEGGEMNQGLNLEQARETTKLEGGSEHTKEMIRGLTQVPWERVDVSFQKSRQRYIAHSTIQVKSYWLNSDGADVVYHMIDNFLL